jgi:bifunctional DNA-binding transcriptional regulator/antitoxin component of YhaV-PrlF toxin-antitoxin module
MHGKPEATITSQNQVSLPAKSLKELGWQRGAKLIVSVLGNDTLVLTRRPESWADRFSGKTSDGWGDHEDTLRYLAKERASWEAGPFEIDADDD